MEMKKVNVKVEVNSDFKNIKYWWRLVKKIEGKQYSDRQFPYVQECEWINRNIREARINEGDVIEVYAGSKYVSIRGFFEVKEGEVSEIKEEFRIYKHCLRIENAKKLTNDELFKKFGFILNDLGFWEKK
jgi:hypothetical protein